MAEGKKKGFFQKAFDEMKQEANRSLGKFSRNMNQSFLFSDTGMPPELLWIDCSDEKLLDKFWSVSDGDLGGSSTCTLERSEEGHMRFYGKTQLSITHRDEGHKPGFWTSFVKPPGPKLTKTGFAGFSSKPFELVDDIDNYNVILLRLKADGRKYYFNIQTESLPGDSVFRAEIQTKPGVWQTVRLLPRHFRLVSHGVPCLSTPRMNWRCVRTVGMAINDGKEGPFDLTLESCKLNFDERVERVDDT